MKPPEVTIKVSPFELQVIYDSLRLYAAKMRSYGKDTEEKAEVPIYDADPHKCALTAVMIMREIGLK